MESFSTSRAAGILSAIVVLFVALVARVAFLQTYGREESITRAERQQQFSQVLPARRGGIFDRNGFLMAGTVQTQTLFIDPKFMLDSYQSEGHSLVEMDEAIAQLARILDRDPFELSQLLGDKADSRFLKVAENLDDGAVAAIDKLDIPGAGIVPADARYYPMGSIGAHILGGCGAGGDGLDGVEMKFNKLLAGRDGYERMTKDARRRAIAVAAEDYLPPDHGQHLVLTVDSNIQMFAEQELAATCEKFKAKRAECVAIDPATGDVLALANYPTFNPQNLDDSTPDERCDSALVRPYEPGSTFKPFFVGPALMWHVTTPSEIWTTGGLTWHTPYGRRITDVHPYSKLSTWDGLVKSSNIVMSMLSERMGNPRMYSAITRFGFGKPTGIELPGENGGKINPLARWNKFSTESVAQGYEVMVTPLQLARAFRAYANGGHLVQPRLVKGVLDPAGNMVARNPPPALDALPQVIDAQTALELRRILCDVVIRGTAKGTRSRTWNIAGKTGTAHISNGRGGYSDTKFTSSFIACAPAENPKIVIAYIVHEADKSITQGHAYGGTIAAPGAVKFMERTLRYLEVPGSPDLTPPPPAIADTLWEFDPKQVSNRNFGAPVEN